MSNSDDETKPDMTRIEDLSEYLHEEDPETDAQFDIPPTPDQDEEEESFETMSVDDLEDAPPTFEEPSDDNSIEDDEEVEEEVSSFESDDSTFDSDDDNTFGSDDDSFSGESTEPDFETPAEFSADSEDDEDGFATLDEVQEIEEESSLIEEVENEIQDAMSEEDNEEEEEAAASFDSDDSFEADDSEDSVDSEEPEEAFSFSEETEETNETEEFEEPFEEPAPLPEVSSAPPPSSPIVTPSPAPKARENFSDINEFGNAISYGQVTAGGNPPFSLILRKIKYLEDSERIIEILREHGLCDESNESDYQQGLNNGSMLISQLNEYSAIYLAHKFRRFDLEILVGLADEIHPSKNYDMDYKGLVRKENLRQNKSETFSLEDQIVEVEAILLATTPTLENYRIDRYLGLVSTHIMIEEAEFQKLQETDSLKNEVDADEILKEIDEELNEEKSHTAVVEVGLEEIYQNLAEALKVKAYKLRGNAVVGINYQITPLINQKSGDQTPSIRYKISCTGNAVWVGGKEAPRSEA
ncbi:MAG: hypothetical protein CME70_16115 [Halobacteriovorax sp.]|nr:hypothetical protein [Halobacteriovorax sp.]|tara:strand:+ start:90538 stop:92118 length:1581 start_codon:yes stop_codon:yes gene_type:complete